MKIENAFSGLSFEKTLDKKIELHIMTVRSFHKEQCEFRGQWMTLR